MDTTSAVRATLAAIGADSQGHITIWDRGAVDFIGYGTEQMLGRNVELLVPHEYRDRHRAGFAAAMGGGPRTADAAPFHLPVLLANGSTEVFAVRFVFLDDPAGQPAGAMILLQRALDVEAWTPVPTGTMRTPRAGEPNDAPQ
ncbi:MAG: PAS domain-containing protein [Acidimicrobiales bacterium]